MLDKPGNAWYYNTRKREGKPQTNQKGRKKMEFYSMEQFEIMADVLEDYQEWVDFEADMATNPYGN